MLEITQLHEMSEYRRKVLGHEPISDDEWQAIVRSLRDGRMSAAVSTAKKKTKAAKEEIAKEPLPSLGSLFD